ncbi:hypothetical protein EDD18DRAFT_1360020 [Armillaria luteobubalina]|uniref:Reverse transcriptase RNase H-like domain-containing protein n=1 Tax=Armillaria luteobubalina TaxID=153913 RepID=A0AA39PRS3_9AGAR|nr:hypothetical protein EDD18DRAFT_1360020 [Armillaria luteobubalina]
MDYLSQFNFDITYIKGDNNKVADCLSRYYKNDTWEDMHNMDDYIQADTHINLNGDDLPPSRLQEVHDKVIEICAMQDVIHKHSQGLQEKKEIRDTKALEMADAAEKEQPTSPCSHTSMNTQLDYTLTDMLQSRPDLAQTYRNNDVFADAV